MFKTANHSIIAPTKRI